MTQKQSEQMKASIEGRLDEIVVEIAKELKNCFERRSNETIFDSSPYFHLMVKMGLVNDWNPVRVDLLFGNSYNPNPGARKMYDKLVEEGFYERPEFFWD